jgi:cytidylate kinase
MGATWVGGFPDAQTKVFLTASVEVRAERRYKQLIEKGIAASIQPLLLDLRERDERDSQRSVAPLQQNEDAELLDTTALTIEQAVAQVLGGGAKTVGSQSASKGVRHSCRGRQVFRDAPRRFAGGR